MTRRFAKLLAAVLITLQLLSTATAIACGPFSLDAIFTFTVHPEYPLENFARGDIGAVQPTYARSYLYVAYSYLSGKKFTPEGQAALVELWRDRLNLRWEPAEEPSMKRWQTERQKIPGVSEAPKTDVYRSREKPNEYETYLNCQKDAFETAANTLEARAKAWSAESASLKLWIDAQDQVFANCSEGKHIPLPLPADADSGARADRQYQIVAANFYAGNFEEALDGFQSIAADRSSPWRTSAPYLIGRTYLRKASLGGEEQKAESLAASEEQLKKVLSNSELLSSHADARRLLGIVRLRSHPRDVVHELAKSLAGKSANPNLKQELWDYTLLLDQFADDEPAFPKAIPADLITDDLTDWLLNFQSKKPDSAKHAVDRWRTTSSVPWLVAALSKVDSQDPSADALKRAAATIPSNSPAFPSVAYYAARLEIAAGRFNNARAILDELFSKYRSRLNVSTLNLLRHERMIAANNLDEFLTYAQRVPAGMSWNDDGREIPADPEENPEVKSLADRPLFGEDAAKILNEKIPISLLKQAATSKTLPEHLRRDVAQAAWIRAVILRDEVSATELVPTLKSLVPELAPLLDKFFAARDPEAKTFAATYAWLKFPGLEPIVDAGNGRQIPLGQQDSYRDNWWCSAAFPASAGDAETNKRATNEATTPGFLTRAQRASASKEHLILLSLGAGPNYLSRQVVDWATRNPNDARVPEALHLAVTSTRYGCTNKDTGRWSKAAYDFLHRRYPNSVWTKQTPYWFKD